MHFFGIRVVVGREGVAATRNIQWLKNLSQYLMKHKTFILTNIFDLDIYYLTYLFNICN